MHHVSDSESINTGVAPVYVTASAVAIFVEAGTIISSPSPTPIQATARARAVVPLVVVIPCEAPHCLETRVSNSPL